MAAKRQRRARGGGRRRVLDAHAGWLLALAEDEPDLTLEEIRVRLEAQGVVVGIASIWRFFDRNGLSFKKKTVRATEQDRADVRAAREAWQAARPSLDPARLIFVDGRADGGSTAPPPNR